jgi:hypothetical protein
MLSHVELKVQMWEKIQGNILNLLLLYLFIYLCNIYKLNFS